MVLHIPHTKVLLQGEDMCWVTQEGPMDPDAALAHHLKVNSPPETGHLFTYHHKNGHQPLTKSKFLVELAKAVHTAELEPLQGHGIGVWNSLAML